ncbi:DUF1788 domain-containing protein [Adlercreutzia sp. R21]|uniref:DUF1788 domain-containing protein n=1 Tax=Adlercreutzia wanghongyangiae TaxID=3111451 RepID=UPI002DBC6DEA|nr:DUF1788 domain-containing protein [Adlercreutzia sp. R21]MEC4183418.1 DUF1788 domain-containing protein [Adlercreutzia sp. R21]
MAPAASALDQARSELAQREAVLRSRLADPDFLANRGLGNEVGIYLFCYDPALELEVRDLVGRLSRESEAGVLPCRLVERNLYDLLLGICDERRVSDAIPRMEAKRGTAALLDQLRKTASTDAFAKALDYGPHEPGDVLLITGVGEVYPLLRTHALLDNIQHLFADIPLVVAYPGCYDGASMRLFAGAGNRGLEDGNYYRAFSLV